MTNFTIVETSAGTAVGTDLMTQAGNGIIATDNRPRILKRIGVTGSAVLRDAYIEVWYGLIYVGRYYPSTVGVVNPVEAKDMMPVVTPLAIPANTALRLIVGKASVTNAFAITLELVELGGV